MDEFREAKAAYEATPIPEELGGRVWAGVCQGRASRRRARRRRMLRTAGSFAACLALLVVGLYPRFRPLFRHLVERAGAWRAAHRV